MPLLLEEAKRSKNQVSVGGFSPPLPEGGGGGGAEGGGAITRVCVVEEVLVSIETVSETWPVVVIDEF